MKPVSYKEYKKEVNKKKKSTTDSKKKNDQNIKSTNSNKPIKKESVSTTNKKDSDISKKNNIQNVEKKESVNTTNKKNTNVSKNTEVTSKQNNNSPINETNLDLIIKKEEFNNITEDDDIKILNDKELNDIIKIYEKDIKKETPKKRKKKRRIRWNNVTLLMFILIFLTILIISSINIVKWLSDSKSTNDIIDEIQNNTQVNEVIDSEETEIIVPTEEEEEIPEQNPYWDYINMNLIDVDFSELKSINNEIVGWIKVNGTNINYPFVQADNNDFYLNHSIDKTYNRAGWVFMDYRNDKTNFSKNTILYAHGRADNTMFGSLKKVIFNKWLSNSNNHVVKLSTETENTLWQVFSVYKIPTTNDYIQVNFVNDQDFLNFGNMLINRSQHNFNTTINENDKILTLSSCYNDDEKVVLHAKLIKVEKK